MRFDNIEETISDIWMILCRKSTIWFIERKSDSAPLMSVIYPKPENPPDPDADYREDEDGYDLPEEEDSEEDADSEDE